MSEITTSPVLSGADQRKEKGTGVGWFKWKQDLGEVSTDWVDSRDFGLWCAKMPPVTKPEEKSQFVQLPGRGSFLTITEGDWAYKPYLKEVTVILPLVRYHQTSSSSDSGYEQVNPGGESTGSTGDSGSGSGSTGTGEVSGDGEVAGAGGGGSGTGSGSGEISGTPTNDTEPVIPDEGDIDYLGFPEMCLIHEILRGEGHVIFSTEPGYRYHAHIAAKIEFVKVGHDMVQAKIPFYCAPFRQTISMVQKVFPTDDEDTSVDEEFEVEGNIPTRPKLYVQRQGSGRDTAKDITVKLQWTNPENNKLIEQTMKFYDMKTAACHALCEPQICLNADEDALWTKKVEGAYFWLYPGTNRVICEDNVKLTFWQNWRWV